MTIWKVEPDVNNYMWILFSETDKMNCLQFSHLLRSNGQRVTLDEEAKFHYQEDNNNKIGDIMRISAGYWLASEKAQKLISSEYGEIFQFIPTTCENEPDTNYYIMLPLVFCEALDMDKSIYKCYRYGNIISSISQYCFNEEAYKYPFFLLKQGDYYHYGGGFYSNDEFKDFIEKNNITGLKFTKIFEFED